MDSKGVRRLYLLLRPKGRLSPGRKTPPGVSAPSAGLRPLIVSRVKYGGRTLSQPLSEVPYELSTDAHSKKCKRSPQQFVPAGFPLHDNLPTGTEDSVIPLTTPDMVRSGRVLQTSVKSPFKKKCLQNY